MERGPCGEALEERGPWGERPLRREDLEERGPCGERTLRREDLVERCLWRGP